MVEQFEVPIDSLRSSNGENKSQKIDGIEASETGSSGMRFKASMPLFMISLSAILLFLTTGAVYTAGVIRTVERRFGLRSSQTGFLSSCNDITHMSLVIFVGYFGRKGHKPRILSVTIMVSAVAYLLMASPHWLFDSSTSPKTTPGDIISNGQAGLLIEPLRRLRGSFCDAHGGLKFSVPFAICTKDESSYREDDNVTSHTKLSASFCSASSFDNTGNDTNDCEDNNADGGNPSNVESDNWDVHPAYYVFIFAQLLSGIGNSGFHSLSLAYIDENAPRAKSSLYVGIVTSMYAFGPVGGYMLAAITLRLPENLISPSSATSEIPENPEDPTFIGCWWLGYIFCSVGITLAAMSMWFFPKSFTNNNQFGYKKIGTQLLQIETESDNDAPTFYTFWSQLKEFPKGLLHLLSNKPYMAMLGCTVPGAYVNVGVVVNTVRYIEIHFFEKAFVASSIAAVVSALAGAIGGFAGGYIMSRMRLSPAGAVRLMIISTSCFTAGLLIITFLGCPQVEMAGSIHPTYQTLNVLNDCNQPCACSTDRNSYSPVCGSDNVTYFSACFAGCTNFIDGKYTGCSCIGNSQQNTTTFSATAGGFLSFAFPGFCVPECNFIIPYAITMFIITLIGSLSRVPGTMVNFRLVDDDERSFALSINSFVLNLIGFMPAPLLFGRLIDSSCRLWQRTAAIAPKSSCIDGSKPDILSKGTGSCLLYDTAKFRQRTYGVVFGIEIIDLVLVLVLYRLVVNRKFIITIDDDVDAIELLQADAMNINVANCSIIEDGQLRQPTDRDSEIESDDIETKVSGTKN